MALVRDAQLHRDAPSHGGDRPRLVVTLDFDKLVRHALRAGAIAEGDNLTAGELRRLCCDADILPLVLGGTSELMDIGHTTRTVPNHIRHALERRDQGCVFPGCNRPARACEAHHIIPWWAGGTTSHTNLTLLCKHHHGIVEPPHYPTTNRGQIRLGPDGIPEVVPPYRGGPEPPAIRHQRFRTPVAVE
jgi:hypothetical protein